MHRQNFSLRSRICREPFFSIWSSFLAMLLANREGLLERWETLCYFGRLNLTCLFHIYFPNKRNCIKLTFDLCYSFAFSLKKNPRVFMALSLYLSFVMFMSRHLHLALGLTTFITVMSHHLHLTFGLATFITVMSHHLHLALCLATFVVIVSRHLHLALGLPTFFEVISHHLHLAFDLATFVMVMSYHLALGRYNIKLI